MNLVKWGIASVVVACAAAVACGGSSSSSGNGSGAGTSNSSGGSSSSKGGSSSTTGGSSASSGGSSSHAGSTSTGGAGGGLSCNPMMPDMGATCPAFTNCIETKCKTQLDACSSTSGVCADYDKCAQPCNCDQTCLGNCTASTACMGCFTTAENCVLSQCFNDALSCGTGSGGTGAGGTFSLDAGSQTCADLATCCGTISDAQQKSSCQMLVDQKVDLFCGLAYSSFCP